MSNKISEKINDSYYSPDSKRPYFNFGINKYITSLNEIDTNNTKSLKEELRLSLKKTVIRKNFSSETLSNTKNVSLHEIIRKNKDKKLYQNTPKNIFQKYFFEKSKVEENLKKKKNNKSPLEARQQIFNKLKSQSTYDTINTLETEFENLENESKEHLNQIELSQINHNLPVQETNCNLSIEDMLKHIHFTKDNDNQDKQNENVCNSINSKVINSSHKENRFNFKNLNVECTDLNKKNSQNIIIPSTADTLLLSPLKSCMSNNSYMKNSVQNNENMKCKNKKCVHFGDVEIHEDSKKKINSFVALGKKIKNNCERVYVYTWRLEIDGKIHRISQSIDGSMNCKIFHNCKFIKDLVISNNSNNFSQTIKNKNKQGPDFEIIGENLDYSQKDKIKFNQMIDGLKYEDIEAKKEDIQ